MLATGCNFQGRSGEVASRRLVPDEGDNHAVEVEKEHDEVKPEFGKGLLQRC